MKKILLLSSVLFALSAGAQEIKPAEKGVNYGAVVAQDGDILTPEQLKSKVGEEKLDAKVQGKVVEVCKAEGCWFKMQRADGTTMMVRAANHAFLMPQDLVGKTVIIEGTAVVKEISEELRKHYAEDAGKSKKEIEKIKGPEKDVQFSAKGVLVIE
ncbi:MAG TPA: DUF4920 domain-containing protein [Flavisolibacter sp.]